MLGFRDLRIARSCEQSLAALSASIGHICHLFRPLPFYPFEEHHKASHRFRPIQIHEAVAHVQLELKINRQIKVIELILKIIRYDAKNIVLRVAIWNIFKHYSSACILA